MSLQWKNIAPFDFCDMSHVIVPLFYYSALFCPSCHVTSKFKNFRSLKLSFSMCFTYNEHMLSIIGIGL